MREVVFIDWCDEHFADNEKKEPATFTITLGIDGEWKTLSACDEHGEKLMFIAGLLRTLGERVDKPKRRPGHPTGLPSSRRLDVGPVQCPLCPPTSPPQSSRKVWRGHLRQTHGLTVPQFRVQHPDEAAALDALAKEVVAGSGT